ncbi:MAG: VTT domain-containing protein [Verrucomicrobiota bacterium]
MRFLTLFLLLSLLVVIPFVIWGEAVETFLSAEGTSVWLESFGSWAWAAGLAVLASDLFLPIPSTVVMAALGYLYGPWWGGCLSALGSVLSGLLGYGLCRGLGQRAARWIAGDEDLNRGRRLFARSGGWIVAISRWLPVFPEVISSLAGLTRMPFSRFLPALLCGGLPLGFTFAAIGAFGHDRPGFALILSALLPPLLWLGVSRLPWFSRKEIER